jgi:MFS family permease
VNLDSTAKVTIQQRLGLLSSLYFVQGLPYGFQATALPAILRSQGMSLAGIGLLGVLFLPWILKALWAPLIDRWGSTTFGPRKSWIVPLQLALVLTCLGAALTPPGKALTALLVLVLFMNLFAATMDIAVDGLAVDTLRRSELGYGNAVQVVGYKVGMITGGGLLLWASRYLGWQGIFVCMAAATLLVLLITIRVDERRYARPREVAPETPDSVRAIVAVLMRTCLTPGGLWLLLLVATYKLGESMADTMFRPFLVDAGISLPTIGLWLGTYGLVFSLVGSIAGGLLASRMTLQLALGITATLRVFPLIGQWALASGWLSLETPQVLSVICAEGFFGGALTTATFAYMMSRVERSIGATHFTALASIEVLGKILGTTLSGFLAEHLGYEGLFASSVALSFAFLLLLPRIRTPVTSAEGF